MKKYFTRPGDNNNKGYTGLKTDEDRIKHIQQSYLDANYLLGFIDPKYHDKVVKDLISKKAKLEVIVETLRPDDSNLNAGISRELRAFLEGVNGNMVKSKGALIEGKADSDTAKYIELTFNYNASHLNDHLK
ncbi:MAG: hypothetical protein ACRC2K_11125 [Clostridium sp.]